MAAALRQNRARRHWGGSGCAGGRRWLVWLKAAAAAAGVASGDGSDRSCRRWKQKRQWLSQGSAVVAGAGRRSDGGSGCEQVRRCRLGRIRDRLGEGEEN